MRTVRDDDGTPYLLLKESADASLVRDPETGDRRYVRNDRLTAVDRSPLVTAAGSLPDAAREALGGVRDERGLGLLFELDRRGPLDVRTLLVEYGLCESDLHGLLAELRAGGFIEEADGAGERGYTLTESASEALAVDDDPG